MKKKYIFLLSILTISVSAELFKCKLPEYQVKPGAKACSDRPFKLKEVPKEFSGLTGIQTKMGDKQGSALKLLLNQPARIYGVFNWPRLLEASEWSKLPKGWSLYWKSAPNIFKNFTCDIYFLDLPAGGREKAAEIVREILEVLLLTAESCLQNDELVVIARDPLGKPQLRNQHRLAVAIRA